MVVDVASAVVCRRPGPLPPPVFVDMKRAYMSRLVSRCSVRSCAFAVACTMHRCVLCWPHLSSCGAGPWHSTAKCVVSPGRSRFRIISALFATPSARCCSSCAAPRTPRRRVLSPHGGSPSCWERHHPRRLARSTPAALSELACHRQPSAEPVPRVRGARLGAGPRPAPLHRRLDRRVHRQAPV